MLLIHLCDEMTNPLKTGISFYKFGSGSLGFKVRFWKFYSVFRYSTKQKYFSFQISKWKTKVWDEELNCYTLPDMKTVIIF